MKLCIKKIYPSRRSKQSIFITGSNSNSIKILQSQQQKYFNSSKKLIQENQKRINSDQYKKIKKNTSIIKNENNSNNYNGNIFNVSDYNEKNMSGQFAMSQLFDSKIKFNKQNINFQLKENISFQSSQNINFKSSQNENNFPSIDNTNYLQNGNINFPQSKADKITFQQPIQNQKLTKTQQKQCLYDFETQEIFKILQRNLISSQQKQEFTKKKKNFYQNLRIKLLNQVDQISRDYKKTQKEKLKFQLLIQGCNIQKHKRRTNNFNNAKKSNNSQSNKNKNITCLNLNLQFDDKINNKQRIFSYSQPNTSRASNFLKIKKSQRQFNPNKSQRSFNAKKSQIQIIKKRNYSYLIASAKQENNPNISFLNKNQECKTKKKLPVSTIKRSMSMNISHKENHFEQNIKQKIGFVNKLQQLKLQCQQQNSKGNQLKKKMKLFGHYCQNLDKGFDNISTKIKNYISNL